MGAREHWRILQRCQRRHRPNANSPIFSLTNSTQISLEATKADETCGLNQSGLHHQHEGGAASNRAHTGIPRTQEAYRFTEGCGFCKIEGFHEPAFAAKDSIAALKFSPNCFETSALFARKTGSPRPPSLPAMLIWDVYRISV